MGHPQFLKQGKRFPQQLLSMHDASLTVLCELNCGSCEEGACEFRAQAFALSDLLGSAQVHPCRLPIVTLSGEQSQDAINEKPVVLAAKCQQTGIEEDSSFLISHGKRRLQLALCDWVRFLLIGKKAVDLVEEGTKHGAGQMIDNGMCSLDHLL